MCDTVDIMEKTDVSAFQAARDAALERLSSLDAEITETEVRLAQLRGEREPLSRLAEAAEQLTADTHGVPATRTVAPPMQTIMSDELPQPPNTKRVITPDKTVYKVGLIFKRQARPMSRQEVVKAFKDAGWTDPEWSSPKGTIFAAIRRAEEYRWVTSVEGQRDVFRTTLLPVDDGGESPELNGGDRHA